MKRQTHSKTSLFLMEILLTVLFFSIASAICIQFFVKAHFISLDSKELSHGTVLCENAAEIYRSGDGSLSSLLSIYPDAVMDGNTMLIYFDSSFVRSDFSDSSYCLEVDYACDNANCYADIFFRSNKNSHTIYKLHVVQHTPLTLGSAVAEKGGFPS